MIATHEFPNGRPKGEEPRLLNVQVALDWQDLLRAGGQRGAATLVGKQVSVVIEHLAEYAELEDLLIHWPSLQFKGGEVHKMDQIIYVVVVNVKAKESAVERLAREATTTVHPWNAAAAAWGSTS